MSSSFKTNSTSRVSSDRFPAWLIAVAYLVLPNLPSLLSASVFGSGAPHGLINVECLAIGVSALFLSRSGVFSLLLAELVLDYAFAICYTYRFTLGELLSSLRYIVVMPPVRIAAGLIAFVCGVGICAALAYFRPAPTQRKLTAALLVTCVLVPGIIDVIDGQNFLVHRDATLSTYRMVRSPLMVLATWEASALRQERKEQRATTQPMASASESILKMVDEQKRAGELPNVVLVVVESWGLFNDQALAQQFESAYLDSSVTASYTVTSGIAPFSGLTVPGEARELCHSTLGMGLIKASADQLKSCLPTVMRERGYETVALHGYMGQMFYRDQWYPKIGFEQSLFRKDLQQAGLPLCKGAFPGICDASVAQFIGSRFLITRSAAPKFIYWVTLNSHLPVPTHPDLSDDNFCSARSALEQSPALCSWFRLEKTVHMAIAELAATTPGRPTIFVVVGDHAPPFSSAVLRAQFSSQFVPYVILTPRNRATQ